MGNLTTSIINLMDPLLIEVQDIPVLDGFQYVSTAERQIRLPKHIRLFLRHRMAADLGKAVHNQYTLVVALKTAGAALVNRSHIRLRPGQALLIMPGQVHDYANIEDQAVLWLFCGFQLDSSDAYPELRNTPVTLDPSIVSDLTACVRLSFAHRKQAKRQRTHWSAQIALRLHLVLDQLATRRNREQIESYQEDGEQIDLEFPLIQKACNYISSRLDTPIAIAEVAEALHVSPGHLRNEFHHRIGCGLGQYIRYLKMHNACILMDTTDLPLNQISEHCGYGSIYSFSRAFKKDKGISPSKYRSTYC